MDDVSVPSAEGCDWLVKTFEHAPVGLAHVHPSGRFLRVNPWLCQLLGYSSEELTNLNVSEITHADDVATSRESMRAIHAGEVPTLRIDKRYLRKDGVGIWARVTASCIRGPDGSPAYDVAVVEDISERRQAEHARDRAETALREMAHQWQRTFDASSDGIFLLDVESRVVRHNQAAVPLLQIHTPRMVGRPCWESVHGTSEQPADCPQRRMRQTKRRATEQILINGRWCQVTTDPILDDSGQIIGAVHVVRDVTEQKRIETQMVQADKMLSLGALAAGMAHEINNPIAGMVQNAQVVLNRITESSDTNVAAAREAGTTLDAVHRYMQNRCVPDLLSAIRASGSRAAQIVSNMLRYGRPSRGQRLLVDMATLLDQALDLAASDFVLREKYQYARILVNRQDAPDLPPVPCVPEEVQQVVLNLVRNAAQAVSRQQSDKQPTIWVRTAVEGEVVRIEVEDNGPGLDAAVVDRLFEPFVSMADEGSGLGLFVSHFIVTRNHGGTLEAFNCENSGARFTIRLPLAPNGVI